MTSQVDINADMGESYGAYRYGEDETLIGALSSANLACGFHAGDPTVMRDSIALAQRHHVAIGAHVGFRDVLGFGRRRWHLDPADLKNEVLYQLGALGGLARAQQADLHHVKAHGALYMMALEDEAYSRAIVEAVLEYDDALMIYTVPGSATDHVARQQGLRVVAEFFADRPYFADGRVKMFGWTLDELGGTPAAIAQRVRRLVAEGAVSTLDGPEIRPAVETICIHSDTPSSSQIAHAVRRAVLELHVNVAAP